VDHLNLIETEPGAYSLTMYSGDLPVDPVVQQLGHEPNGVFWDGIAEWLVETELHGLEGLLAFDSEAGMFCAYGSDRAALERLGAAMGEVVTDPDRLRELVSAADAAGFEFDD